MGYVASKSGGPMQTGTACSYSVGFGPARQYSIKNRVDSVGSAAKHLVVIVLSKFVYFFLWPELCVPLLAVPWMLGDRRVRVRLVEQEPTVGALGY